MPGNSKALVLVLAEQAACVVLQDIVPNSIKASDADAASLSSVHGYARLSCSVHFTLINVGVC